MNDTPPDGSRFAEVLRDPVRRGVVATIVGQSPPLDLDDVTERVVAWLEQRDGDDRTVSGPRHVKLQLHHVHLPKLASVGLVEYDGDAKTVWDYSLEPLASARQMVEEMFGELQSDGGERDARPRDGDHGGDDQSGPETPRSDD